MECHFTLKITTSIFSQAWVLTCIFFVFGALLEYSLILLHLKIYSYQQDQKGGGVWQAGQNHSAAATPTGTQVSILPTTFCHDNSKKLVRFMK
jgi:hypothetical protein